MNTTHTNNRIWLFIALLLLAVSLNGWADRPDSSKKKEVSQSFSAGGSDMVRLDNRYGSITVTHWEKAEVAIRVVIESKANSDSKAQEGLDRVDISLNKTGNTISGVTSLKSQFSGNNSNNRLTINYYVSMPSQLAISVSQKYGNINLPEQNPGKATLEVKYGNIKAGSFTSSLSVDAGYSNVNLEDVQDLTMDLAYCGNVSFNNGNNIRIDSKYSNLKLRNIVKLNLDKKYGNISIQNAEAVTMDIKYSEASIERLKEELSVNTLDYSTLKVNELSSDFKKVNVSARYGNFNVSIPQKAVFKVSAERMKYGKVDVKGFTVTDSRVDNKTDYTYQINGGGNKTIYFNGNSYSNIRIKSL